MRAIVISLLAAIAAVQPVKAEDQRECRLQPAQVMTVNASFRADILIRKQRSAPICPRATRQMTPSCFPATAMLTQ